MFIRNCLEKRSMNTHKCNLRYYFLNPWSNQRLFVVSLSVLFRRAVYSREAQVHFEYQNMSSCGEDINCVWENDTNVYSSPIFLVGCFAAAYLSVFNGQTGKTINCEVGSHICYWLAVCSTCGAINLECWMLLTITQAMIWGQFQTCACDQVFWRTLESPLQSCLVFGFVVFPSYSLESLFR